METPVVDPLDPLDPSATTPASSSATPPVTGQTPAAPKPTGGSAAAPLVAGKKFLIGAVVVLLTIFAVNYVAATRNRDAARRHTRASLLIRDPAQTSQRWHRETDGMTFTVTLNAPAGGGSSTQVGKEDARNIREIREYLREQRVQYLRGDYSDPKFGKDDIPGRADLEFGTQTGLLNCRFHEVPGGGELRWITTDSIMLDSLNEWSKRVASTKADFS